MREPAYTVCYDRIDDQWGAGCFIAQAPASIRKAPEARLRVLVVTRIFPNRVEPLSSPFNRQQFAALGRLCDVEVMATIPWFPGARFVSGSKTGGRTEVPKTDVIDGLPVVHPRVAYVPRLAGLSGALEVASLLPSFLARRGRVDVVLGSWAYPEGAAAVALAKIIGVPAVIKAHGSDLNVQGNMRGPRANLAVALPRAARVVVVSRALGERAVALGAVASKVCVVANGIDTSIFRVRDRNEARDEVGYPRGPKMVLYVGRVERDKGIIELVGAMKEAEGLSLVVLGDGGALSEAREKAAPLGDRVRFLGARPLAEVPAWMAASTICTLPSYAEGSPNVVREALACGRAVVGTNVGGIPELIDAPELGLLVPAPRCARARAGSVGFGES